MGVTRVATGNAGDREGKGEGQVCGVSVCAEADFPACEAIHELERGIFTRFPSFPNTQGGLASVDVARTAFPVPVSPMDAGTADEAIQARLDCFHGVHRFDKDPHLNHRARLPVVTGNLEAGGNDHSVAIFVENESVAHREPPLKIAMIACRFDSLWSRDRFVRR
jgi:hypothetical protein